MQTAIAANAFKRNLSAKQKNEFGSAALPLGQGNYGKVIGKKYQISQMVANAVKCKLMNDWRSYFKTLY